MNAVLLHCPTGHDAKFSKRTRRKENITTTIITCLECSRVFTIRQTLVTHYYYNEPIGNEMFTDIEDSLHERDGQEVQFVEVT